MKLSTSKNANINYLARVVKLSNLRPLEGSDRLDVVTIDGNNVFTGKGALSNGDIVVYFPVGSTIDHLFLSYTNSFSNKELNANSEEKGYFNKQGRVKPLKLRFGHSVGYIVPIKTIAEFAKSDETDFDKYVDVTFDTLQSNLFVKKYVIPGNMQGSGQNRPKGPKGKLLESRLVDNQFKFHSDTSQLGRNYHLLNLDDIITITWKMHGTSFVSSNILTKKKESKLRRLLSKVMGYGLRTEYANIYSSRKVIKNEYLQTKDAKSYYKSDVWGDANDRIKDHLIKGETVYGEIVGKTADGSWIQKEYDYKVPENRGFDVYVYRITHTNIDGNVIELDYNQIKQRCEQFGIGVYAVPHIYTGTIGNYLPEEVSKDRNWREDFYNLLRKTYADDQDSQFCENKVPEEGICVRIEGLNPVTYKLKSYRFLGLESDQMDKGETNIEDEQV